MNQNLLNFLVLESGLSITYERERIENLIKTVAKYCIGEYAQRADNEQAESSLRLKFDLLPQERHDADR
jgi:hypothetical protein